MWLLSSFRDICKFMRRSLIRPSCLALAPGTENLALQQFLFMSVCLLLAMVNSLRICLHYLQRSFSAAVSHWWIKPFTRMFLKWTLPSLYWSCPLLSVAFVLLKIITRLANSVDPDETAHYGPSHLDVYYLCRYLYRSTELRGLRNRRNDRIHQVISSVPSGHMT